MRFFWTKVNLLLLDSRFTISAREASHIVMAGLVLISICRSDHQNMDRSSAAARLEWKSFFAWYQVQLN
ncbi:hypothetical protein AXA65_13605 [Chryseobacterium sp. FP211-J200]|nr:hypothetical protein AXA65_13605 [Chryseobacterium sp. FP211-J200]